MNASIPVSLHLKDADAVGGHACRWQSMVVQLAKALAESEVRAAGLEALVAERDEDIDAYKRRLYGHKSEKMPGPNKALLKRGDIAKPTPEEIQRRRAEGRNWKEELPTEDVVHLVPTTTDICGLCGTPPNHALPSQVSYTVDIVPSRVVRHRHIREYARCECGSCVISGPAPVRVGEKGHCGPRLAASLIVAKCLDAVAIERYAKQLGRMGVPVSVNTLSDLFHRAGEMLVRLYNLLLAQVKASDLVHADETRQQALDNMGPVPRTPAQTELYAKTRRAWVWVFIAGKTIVYKYSPSRSGETPVVDAAQPVPADQPTSG